MLYIQPNTHIRVQCASYIFTCAHVYTLFICLYVSICICSLTVGHILIEMIAIGLIALHMIIGPRCCGRCIHRWRSKCARCLCIKFSGKLMNTREWASERGEIHHDSLCF